MGGADVQIDPDLRRFHGWAGIPNHNEVPGHGAATRAHISLRFASRDLIVITISDNGRGIPWVDEDKPIGMGLLGMRERAAILGGALTIRRRPRGGTTITARLKKEALAWSPKPALFAS